MTVTKRNAYYIQNVNGLQMLEIVIKSVRVQKMKKGDRIIYYVMKLHKFGASATIIGDYFYDKENKLWIDENEIWPARRASKPDIVLDDDELIDEPTKTNIIA